MQLELLSNCHRLGEGFMAWARVRARCRAKRLGVGIGVGVGLVRASDGSSSCTAVRRQFHGAFTMDNRVPTCSIIHAFYY